MRFGTEDLAAVAIVSGIGSAAVRTRYERGEHSRTDWTRTFRWVPAGPDLPPMLVDEMVAYLSSLFGGRDIPVLIRGDRRWYTALTAAGVACVEPSSSEAS